MPSFTVPLQGGGSMTVNASSQQAAEDNVRSTGNTPSGSGGGGSSSAPASSGGGGGQFQTKNGVRTVDQMAQELKNVGWGGNSGDSAAVLAAYGNTTGQAVQPVWSSGTGGTPTAADPNAAPGTQNAANLAAGQLLLDKTQQAAYQAYLNAKLALDTDQEAYQKAAQAAATEIAQAGVTGTYQGQPTQQAIKQAADIASQQAATMLAQAQTFGAWGSPQQGQQTLAAQNQAFTQAQQAAQLTGWYSPYTYTPPAAAQPGAPAAAPVAAVDPSQFYQQDAQTQALYNQYHGANAAADWARDATKAVQSTVNQAAAAAPQTSPGAQTIPGASATLGAPPGYQAGQPIQTLAANQQYFQQQIDAQKQALAQWQAQQTASQNYLSLLAGLRGPADYAKYQQVLGATPGGMKDLVAAAAGQYVPGGGATTGVQPQAVNLQNFVGSATGATDQNSQAALNSLVAPNQMAPQTWNALTPSQQQMLLGTWESQGYTKEDAQALFNQSLPKYATSAPSAGAFRLQ